MREYNMSEMPMQMDENQMNMNYMYGNMGMQPMYHMNPMCHQMNNPYMSPMMMNEMHNMKPMNQMPMNGMMNPAQGMCFIMIPCHMMGMHPMMPMQGMHYPMKMMEMDEDYMEEK